MLSQTPMKVFFLLFDKFLKHFLGSRYVSWFPSFSVEVNTHHADPLSHAPPAQTSQLDAMARQVISSKYFFSKPNFNDLFCFFLPRIGATIIPTYASLSSY